MFIDEFTGFKAIDLGGGARMVFPDGDNSIQNFESYIGDMGWQYTRSAIEKIFEVNYRQKANIRNVLKNHPNYVEEKRGIVFKADFIRNVDTYKTSAFCNWLDRAVNKIADERDFFDRFPLIDAAYLLTGYTSQFLEDFYAIERLNKTFAEYSVYGLQKLHVHAGQKRSRIVGKFCKMLGIDTAFPDYKQRYDSYCEAVNPFKIPRFTVISTNPTDFLRMSDGAGDNPWRSCHNPNKETFSGCNCSGGISHALDTSSIIMYTVAPDYNGDLQCAGKVDRCIFFVDEDLQHFVQSKVYPDGSESKSNEFREIFQTVWSQCTGELNLWTKAKDSEQHYWEYIELGENATVYPDFESSDRRVHFYPSGADKDSFKKIIAGAEPICVECGCRHDIADEINCCHFFRGGHICPNCGERIDEDDERWSDYHDEGGCVNCMHWVDVAQDYFFNRDDEAYVQNIREYVPTCYMDYHDDDFARCYECDAWLYIGRDADYYCDSDGEIYCEYCGSHYLSYCEDCGEYYRTEDMVEIDGEYYCEWCAEGHKKSAEETEVA